MSTQSEQTTPLWRDDRVWSFIFQVVIIVLVLGLYGILLYNFNQNQQQTGLTFSFRFLGDPAGFSIGESILNYAPNDTYLWGLTIGAVNTFRLIIVGFISTTIVGILVGVSSFSQNWLLRKISQVYVEIIRNTPLLLQLLFWYFVVFLSFPKSSESLGIFDTIFLSKSGIQCPWPAFNSSLWVSCGILVLILISAILTWRWRIHAIVRQGQTGRSQGLILLALGLLTFAILTIGLNWQFPQRLASGTIEGGLRLSTEYAAVFSGLVTYTAAFIAEIVRGGIQSVSSGQWEAARSLGLNQGQVMQLVVFPQALRVIIPPLNSQYMNLAKNSSLALAIGYPDIYSVASTTLNQTGRPLEVFIVLMIFYLSVNFLITIVMNSVNRLVQIKER